MKPFTRMSTNKGQNLVSRRHPLLATLSRLSLIVSLLTTLLVLVVTPAKPANAVSGTNAEEVWGQTSGGSPTFTQSNQNDTGPNAAGFNKPESEVLDPGTGYFFVADTNTNRVLAYTTDPTTHLPSASAFAALGPTDTNTNLSGRTQAKVSSPVGLALDTTRHYLFVADSGNGRVLVFDVSTVTSGQNAINVIGKSSFTSTTPTSGQNSLTTPAGVAYDSTTKYLYVGDQSTNRVMIFDFTTPSDNPTAVHVLGQADYSGIATGSTASTMSAPSAVAVDTTNHYLYVADTNNNRVTVFSTSSITDGQSAIGVFGQPDLATASNGTTSAKLYHPSGIAIDASRSHVYISDTGNNRVLAFSNSSISTAGPTALFVLGQSTMTGAVPVLSQSGLNTLYQLFFDSANDRLYVADSLYNRLMVWTGSASTNGADATFALGHVDAASNFDWASDTRHGSTPNTTGLYAPYGTVLDAVHHKLFVADYNNNRILVHNLNSSNRMIDNIADNVIGQPNLMSRSTSTWDANTTSLASSMVYSPLTSRLFVYDGGHKRILVFNVSTITNGMAAAYVLGSTSFTSGGGGTTQTNFNWGRALALDDLGNRLFVADTFASRVMVFNVDMNTISNGENASYVLGQSSWTTSGAGNASTNLNTPRGVAYDSANSRLFVSDSGNNRVLVYDASTLSNAKAASYVIGQTAFGNISSGTTQNTLSAPTGLTYDPTYNRLWVADTNNNRVLEYDGTAIATNMNASNVFGQADYVSGSGTSGQARMNVPMTVTYDAITNRIFVPETGNSRFMVWRVGSRISTNSLPDAATNQAYTATVALNVTQGTATYSIGSGALPTGLSLSSAGVISGTPTAAGGTYTFTVTTSDNAGTYGTFTDSTSLSIVVTGLSQVTGTVPDEEWGQYTAGGAQIFNQQYPDNAPPSANGFKTPYGQVFDSNTNTLFVPDQGDSRILAFSVNAITHVPSNTPFAVLGQPDFATISTGSGTSKMNLPKAVALDAVRHQLFVSDYTNGRVLVYDVSSAPTTNQTPTYVIGKSSLGSTTPTTGQSALKNPFGLFYDSSNKYLYVSDKTYNRVTVYDLTTMSNGPAAVHVIGQSDYTTVTAGTSSTTLSTPSALALDTSLHFLFIADQSNNRVLGYDVTSGVTDGMAATGVFGQPNFTSGTVAAATATSMSNPSGLTIDVARSRLYVGDNGYNRVLMYSDSSLPSVGPSATYVIGQSSLTGSTAATTSAGLNNPVGVYYDSVADTVWVGDSSNNRILYFSGSFSANNPTATGVLGHVDSLGAFDYTTDAPYGATPVDSNVYQPNFMALDAVHHRMFVTDLKNNRVLVHNLDTGNHMVDKNADYVIGQPDFVTRAAGTGAANLNAPSAVAYEPSSGYLYVYDYNNLRVLIFNTNSLANGMNASYVLGASSFVAGAGGITQSTFQAGRGLTLDNTRHRLFVSTTSRTLVFDTSALANGMNASFVLGQSTFTSAGTGTSATQVSGTQGSVYDSYTDMFWVVDRNNARVLGYPAGSLSNGMAATAILGNSSFTTITSGVTASTFSPAGLFGIEADPTYHRLWVSDPTYGRVLEFNTTNFTNGEAATSVYGQADFVSSGMVANGLGLGTPNGMTYDSSTNRIWVTETGYHRFSAWEVGTRITSASIPNATTAGVYSSQLANTTAHGTVAYALTSGSLPSGMSLSSTGLFSGTVTAPAGVYTFSVGLTDTNGSYGTFKDYKTYTITVPPSLSFAVSAATSCNGVSQSAGVTSTASAIPFGHVSAASSAISMQTLTVNANATSGFNVYMSSTGLSDGYGHTVPNVSGTNIAPGAAPVGGTSGIGYTTDDSTLGGGTPNRFTNPSAQWAGLNSSGDVVDSSISNTGGSTQNQCVAIQTAFGTSTSAGSYTGTLVYTAIPLF